MPEMVDITAPKIVQVEVVTSPAGHDVMYVHIDGVTVLRVCRFEKYEYKDERIKKSIRKKP